MNRGQWVALRHTWPIALWDSLFFDEGRYEPNATQSAEWNRGAYLVEVSDTVARAIRRVPSSWRRTRRSRTRGESFKAR